MLETEIPSPEMKLLLLLSTFSSFEIYEYEPILILTCESFTTQISLKLTL